MKRIFLIFSLLCSSALVAEEKRVITNWQDAMCLWGSNGGILTAGYYGVNSVYYSNPIGAILALLGGYLPYKFSCWCSSKVSEDLQELNKFLRKCSFSFGVLCATKLILSGYSPKINYNIHSITSCS